MYKRRRRCTIARVKLAFLSSALVPGILVALLAPSTAMGDRVRWRHLSSSTGDLPAPGPSSQQTGSLVGDFDGDGVNDFVLSFRQVPPALVKYRYARGRWVREVIEPDFLTVEAGGAALDIDGDGDLDVVFGGDWQSRDVWWWENPGTTEARWPRHTIKSDGATQHHDQVFATFSGLAGHSWRSGIRTRRRSSWPRFRRIPAPDRGR
jgi:hypothetical protein